ncbi:Hypothetical predicted protein [Olea europaea subsp. europaea]|uniref:Uncharacterized protein n=1 Tax=Olea europaea subsp. europaea TaxID=158383 RepID=A0A8S0U3Z5_OLEEU|nr:Hypothetical predicted protein [Olea europaea subsp. europaea]
MPAPELTITGIKDQESWILTHPPDCTSIVVAELRHATLLSIIGKIDVKNLVKKTRYNAYLVFMLKEGSKGLEQAKATVRYVGDIVAGTYNRGATIFLVDKKEADDFGQVPQPLKYGWKEIKLGDFTYEEGDEGMVRMRLFEKNKLNPKSGLIVKGIEVRPIE